MGALERASGNVTELVGADSVAADSTVSDVMGTDGVRNLVYTAATGTITLPALGTPGQRIRVIKDNATQGTVTIAADGTDTITEAGLSSVSLNADGDYWEFLDISSRWELIAGRETGSNSNGEYVRYADGRQRAWKTLTDLGPIDTARGNGYYSGAISGGDWPENFSETPDWGASPSATGDALVGVMAASAASASAAGNIALWRWVSSASTIFAAKIEADGNWY